MRSVLGRVQTAKGVNRTALPQLVTYRYENEGPLDCSTGALGCSIILSGEKEVTIGSTRIVYHAGEALLSGAELPCSFRAVGASPEHPFLAVWAALDRSLLMEFAEALPPARPAQPARQLCAADPNAACSACNVFHPDLEVLCDFTRLVKLLESPEQIAVRAPLVLRDLHYLLLAGPTRQWLLPLLSSTAPQGAIVKAVSWLRTHYTESIAIEDLARMHAMSTSNFHRHFKNVTGMTPLQFQKQIRLIEAQRLMLSENAQVAEAAYAVGYESATQFVREYKRRFGESPMRDVKRRRTAFADLGRSSAPAAPAAPSDAA